MAKIVGTAINDLLFGDFGPDTILGRRGNDRIFASEGDFANGGRGDDSLRNEGDDNGDGHNDGAVLVGGVGNDTLVGFGTLRGDEQPGLSNLTFGADTLISGMYFDTDQGTQFGGRGPDLFVIETHIDGHASRVDVLDFRVGDKTLVGLAYTDGQFEGPRLDSATVFGVLDTNGDGTLGNDTPMDANSQVTVDVAHHELTIRLHEDEVVYHFAGKDPMTELHASDFLF